MIRTQQIGPNNEFIAMTMPREKTWFYIAVMPSLAGKHAQHEGNKNIVGHAPFGCEIYGSVKNRQSFTRKINKCSIFRAGIFKGHRRRRRRRRRRNITVLNVVTVFFFSFLDFIVQNRSVYFSPPPPHRKAIYVDRPI
jgi:hypothetical protein